MDDLSPHSDHVCADQTLARGRRIGANLAFTLSGETKVWMVTAGAVDVFLVAAPPSGSGIRWHAFRAEAGSMLTSVSEDEAPQPVEWWAVPTADTQVVEVDLSSAATWLRSDSWTAWGRRLTTLAGLGSSPDDASLIPGVAPDRAFRAALDQRVEIIREMHRTRDKAMLATERGRLETRRSLDSHMERQAAESFAAVLHRRNQPPEPLERNPLIAAIELVARYQHIEFRPPKELPSESLPPSTRVTRVLSDAGVLWRRVALDDQWWRRDVGTFLAVRTADGCPMVVHPDGRGRYVLFDPASGQCTPVDQAALDAIGNTGIFLNRPFPQQTLTLRGLLKFGLTGRSRDVWTVALIGLAAGVVSLLTPFATGTIIGDVIPNAAVGQLHQYTFLLVSLTVSSGIFGLAQALMMLRISGHLDVSLQGALWDRLMRLPTAFFRNYTAGDLASRATGINTINSTLTSVTLSTVFSALFGSFNLILMLWYSWQLSLIGIAIVLVTLLVTLGLVLRQLMWQRRLVDSQGRLSGFVLQLIWGINKLRVAQAQPRAFAVWASAFAEQNRLNLEATALDNALTVFSAAIPTIAATIMFMSIAGILGSISVGDFVAFNTAFTQFFNAVLGLTAAVGSSVGIVPLYRRARPILDAAPEVDAASQMPGELSGRISLDKVSFAYPNTGRRILDDISLTIAAGEFVAIVGPSGAGKSTVLRLLMGFEKPSAGVITYDDKDLRSLDAQALRRQLGVVVQNSQIVPGNVFQNITGNSPDFSVEDVWEAAALAGLSEDIKAMPMGMDTLLGEGAATLSTGQRQRLMIARAIIKRPRILMLDEATSALDNKTQATVAASLKALNVTRIVIAQRLSTILDADRILVLHEGRIQQSGTYAQLISQPGLFLEFCMRQWV